MKYCLSPLVYGQMYGQMYDPYSQLYPQMAPQRPVKKPAVAIVMRGKDVYLKPVAQLPEKFRYFHIFEFI